MFEKKNEMKFTILFSNANPNHVFAAEKLNTQSRNNKANYVAQAIRFYEENSGLNKDAIEKVVLDILGKQSAYSLSSETSSNEHLDEKIKESINDSLQIFKRGT